MAKKVGRKPIPDNQKKKAFILYLTPEQLKNNGGEDKAKKKCYEVLGV